MNGATCSAEGIVLDGNNDYVDIDDWEWGGAVTFEVYVKYDSINDWSRVFDFGSETYSDHVLLENWGTASTIGWQVGQGSTYKYLTTSNFDSATWTHVVVSIKDTTMKVYKNGVIVGTKTDGHEPNVITRTKHIIGAAKGSGMYDYLDGTVAFVKMWHGVEVRKKLSDLPPCSPYQTSLTYSSSFFPSQPYIVQFTDGIVVVQKIRTAADTDSLNGYFTLTFGGETTELISVTEAADGAVSLEAKLSKLSTIGTISVTRDFSFNVVPGLLVTTTTGSNSVTLTTCTSNDCSNHFSVNDIIKIGEETFTITNANPSANTMTLSSNFLGAALTSPKGDIYKWTFGYEWTITYVSHVGDQELIIATGADNWSGVNPTIQTYTITNGEAPINVASLYAPYNTAHHFWDFRGCTTGAGITDSIAGDLVATPTNGPTCSDDGIVLDGNDDYLDINDWEWGGAVAFEVYVKYDSFNHQSRVFDFGSGAGSDNVVLCNDGTTSTIYWAALQGSTNKYLDTSNFDSATWTHVVVSIKDTTMKVYKNGILVGTNTDGWEPNVLTRTQHWLGRSAWLGLHDGYFDGTIGYLKMWHGVELTDSDVDALYFCPSGTLGSLPSSCPTCPVGQYSTFPDTLVCSSCPDGKTTTADTDPSNHDSADDCSVICPVGTYSSGGTGCLVCPAGTFSSSPESASCSVCAAGRYNDDQAASADAHDDL